MTGEPIEAAKKGMQTIAAALRKDQYALESVYLSVITFGGEAKQIVPLTEVAQFEIPEILQEAGRRSAGRWNLLQIARGVKRAIPPRI